MFAICQSFVAFKRASAETAQARGRCNDSHEVRHSYAAGPQSLITHWHSRDRTCGLNPQWCVTASSKHISNQQSDTQPQRLRYCQIVCPRKVRFGKTYSVEGARRVCELGSAAAAGSCAGWLEIVRLSLLRRPVSAGGTVRGELMRVRAQQALITDHEAKLLGVAGGKKESVLVLETSPRYGGWMAERKRGGKCGTQTPVASFAASHLFLHPLSQLCHRYTNEFTLKVPSSSHIFRPQGRGRHRESNKRNAWGKVVLLSGGWT
jgi:hypothetical protein